MTRHHRVLLSVYPVNQTLFTTSVQQQKGFHFYTLTLIQNLLKQQRLVNIRKFFICFLLTIHASKAIFLNVKSVLHVSNLY